MNLEQTKENPQDFVQFINQVVRHLDESVRNPNLSQAAKTANGLKGLYDLYDMCLVNVVPLIEYQDQKIGQVMGELHSGIRGII